MAHPHFEHVAEHLARVRDGYAFIPDAEQVYLGRQEKDHFWELVGLRLQGCPVVVLAALRFERLERKGMPDSRESLGVYLSSTPSRPGGAAERRLTALLPHKDQKIPPGAVGSNTCPASRSRFQSSSLRPSKGRPDRAAGEEIRKCHMCCTSSELGPTS